jgi:uncharacterized coiled-coil DUF342 family protein
MADDLPESMRWFQRLLQPLNDKLDYLTSEMADLREDFQTMRDHVDVCVTSTLRMERGQAKLRDETHALVNELREQRRRIEALEEPRPPAA